MTILNSALSIRKARPTDARMMAYSILMAEGDLIPFFTGHTDEELSLKALEDYILSPIPSRYWLGHALVAVLDGETVGAAFSFPADSQPLLDKPILASANSRGWDLTELFFEGEPGTYYLSTMGVDPRFRNRGVGSALMTACEVRGGQLGFAMTSLLVSVEKKKAKALYERLGYVVLQDVTIADRFRYFRMGRQLPASSVSVSQGDGGSSTGSEGS